MRLCVVVRVCKRVLIVFGIVWKLVCASVARARVCVLVCACVCGYVVVCVSVCVQGGARMTISPGLFWCR